MGLAWWKWLLLPTPWTIGLMMLLWSYWSDTNSSQYQGTAIGTVISRAHNHGNEYQYRYTVRGRLYEGRDNSEKLVSPGQPIIVYFNRVVPSRNSLVEFSVRRDRDFGPMPWLLMGVSVCFGTAFVSFREHVASKRSLKIKT